MGKLQSFTVSFIVQVSIESSNCNLHFSSCWWGPGRILKPASSVWRAFQNANILKRRITAEVDISDNREFTFTMTTSIREQGIGGKAAARSSLPGAGTLYQHIPLILSLGPAARIQDDFLTLA